MLTTVAFLILSANPAANAATGKLLKIQTIKIAAEKERVQAFNCQYALLTEKEIRQKLLDLMGEVDKTLDISDYGGPAALESAIHIRLLANQLFFKTSTGDKLALEAFVFANEIAPREQSRKWLKDKK